MSGWRRATFFFFAGFNQLAWDFSSCQAAPVLDQAVEQIAARHWQPGDDLLEGLPLDDVDDVGDLGLDPSGNRLQLDHTRFGWTHPFEAFLPQPTYDDEAGKIALYPQASITHRNVPQKIATSIDDSHSSGDH
jgi:hypothetical protein